jgi:hypothetical protein
MVDSSSSDDIMIEIFFSFFHYLYMETLLAFTGVLFTPTLSTYVSVGEGFFSTLVGAKFLYIGIIVLITLLTNIVRALRYCRGEKGEFSSFGISYGLKKGLLCGIFAVVGLLATYFIPILRLPFTVASLIPGVGDALDGFIMAIFYLFSYVAIAYPIWGAC